MFETGPGGWLGTAPARRGGLRIAQDLPGSSPVAPILTQLRALVLIWAGLR